MLPCMQALIDDRVPPRRRARRRLCAALMLGPWWAPLRQSAAADAAPAAVHQVAVSKLPLGRIDRPVGRWREQRLPGVRANQFNVEQLGGDTVLRVDSADSASSLIYRFDTPITDARSVAWRWRAAHMLSGARFGDKARDDYCARVYVLFDYPLDRVPFGQRTLIRMARTIHSDLPAATLCYVWDAREPLDSLIDSPYSKRVKVIVAASGTGAADWLAVKRDLRSDFARAFGAEYGAGIAPVAALAVAADTDQTGERVSAWFADIEVAQ